MPLTDADVLFGKLAIGRGLLERGDARRLAEKTANSGRTGRLESLADAAVRLGYLDRRVADELREVLRTGELVCRGRCGQSVALPGLRPSETTACARCGGPLYVARRPASEAGPKGTFMELDVPAAASRRGQEAEAAPAGAARTSAPAAVGAAPAPLPDPTPVPKPAPARPEAAPPAGEDGGGGGEFTFFDLDAPDFREDAPPPPAPAPVAPPPGGANRTPAPVEAAAPAGEATVEMDAPPPAPGPTTKWRPAGHTPPGFQPGFRSFRVGPALEVVAPIGRGGMGLVFRARHLPDGETVAVKILTMTAQARPDVLARFEREVRVSAKLDHPNIVKVFRTGTVPDGEFEGKPYYAMDFIEGRDLNAWAMERLRTPAESIRLMTTICAAVNYAHGKGIVHRDIKPANILVRRADDAPVLCDFGLARYRAEVNNLTRTGDILGTPAYMAPEQALSKRSQIGPPTDVYAIGAVLYHLVASRPPFSGPTPFATIDKLVRSDPARPSTLNPKVSPELDAVILKALAKEPVDRYHTCDKLQEALEALAP